MSETGSPNWILKFISGKYQGGEFPLEEGKEYVIGRSSECHMVLVEDMVSRAHAKIVVKEGEVHLYDNGSTNGSFVNGERVQHAVLNEGDRILFGTSIIKLMRAQKVSDTFPQEVMEQQKVPTREVAPPQTQRMTTNATVSGAMAGQLEEVGIADLLQLFSTSRKSGVLRIQSEREASLYLRDGRVIFAEIGDLPDLPPDKAAFRVMTWTKGTFVLEGPSEREFETELEFSTEALMMEAVRLIDEMENLGPGMPKPDSVLTIKRPLVPPLRSLTPELLDTLQLVINYGMVETVLNKSAASDLETMQDLDYLIKNNYVERVG